MIRQSFLQELEYELATTRKTLAAISEDKLTWKPHDKSSSLAGLATHVANLCAWGADTLTTNTFDLEPNGIPLPPNAEITSVSELLDRFDKTSGELRAKLAEASDEQLLSTWSLLKNGKTMMTMPRVAVLRTWILNHIIHHRGQLSVYLRLTGSSVPSIYGPTADDPGRM